MTAAPLPFQLTICHLCSEAIDIDAAPGTPWSFTWDHLDPQSVGGDHDPANLRPAHRRCNIRRGNMPVEQFIAERRHELPLARVANRRDKQLGLRVPVELSDRLDRAAAGTLMPKTRILTRALDQLLTSMGY